MIVKVQLQRALLKPIQPAAHKIKFSVWNLAIEASVRYTACHQIFNMVTIG